jgi:ubiquinone/menaquinone biosynthesis C-methylase UbiE
VSITAMRSPAGWIEPEQTPEFDEFTIVLSGQLHVTVRGTTQVVASGQAVRVPRGNTVRYATPQPGGAEYIAVCTPAFSPALVHRASHADTNVVRDASARAASRVTTAYDRVADAYAAKFWNELEHKHFDRIMLGWYASQIPSDEPVLEIGAGPGEVSGYLGELGVKCVGTDAAPRMVEQARRFFPKIRFEVEDFFALSFSDEAFAGVVAYYAIVNYPLDQVRTILSEAYRVLKREGLFLFTFHVFEGEESATVSCFLEQEIEPITFYYFRVDQVRAMVIEMGFQVVDILVRHPYPGVEFESQRAYFVLSKS